MLLFSRNEVGKRFHETNVILGDFFYNHETNSSLELPEENLFSMCKYYY